MTAENDAITQRLKTIYALREPPWAVALSGFIAMSYSTEFPAPPDVRTAFDALNARLLYWWPRLQPPLGEIYATDYTKCLELYFGVDTRNGPLVKLEIALIKASLLQLRVLSFIEAMLPETRPGIGNEINETTPRTLVELVGDYLSVVSSERAAFVKRWIETLAGEAPPGWEAGLSELFAPLGGPAKPR